MSFGEAIGEFSKPLDVSKTARGQAIHFCNAYSVALAEQDQDFRALINEADVVCCDGVPITWAGRWLFGEVAQAWDRVYGPDVMSAVLAEGGTWGSRHYFLGGTTETSAALISKIRDRWPGAEIVGAESPPFRDLSAAELEEQIDRLTKCRATHVWVGLGQPKQDYAVSFLASRVTARFFAVGAAFDFIAGVKPQAPAMMQKTGTEWAFRLASEPKRLAKRYLWGNPVFVYSVLRNR